MRGRARPASLWRRQIALPHEHGAWVFLLSPLLMGFGAGAATGRAVPVGPMALLVAAALAAFLLRQPVSIAVKAYSGRRSRDDLPAARFWMLAYSLVGLAAVAGLILQGYGYVLVLALPAVPVFVWHLWLIGRRAERRQVGVEVVGSGVLALMAPAAYWVASDAAAGEAVGWWLAGLAWLQSAASIVYAYLRLEQRVLPAVPPMRQRLQMGRPSLLFTSANLAGVAALALAGWLPSLLPAAYAVQWLETLWGTLRPAVGVKPVRIGLRQLAVSIVFTLVFMMAWGY